MRLWLISISQVDKSKVLVLNLLMKTSDGIASPQKSLNYFQLWQNIISAQLCCTSVKANKVAGCDWGSLSVSLSTLLQRDMSITGLRSKENICNTQICKYLSIHTFFFFASVCFHLIPAQGHHPFVCLPLHTSFDVSALSSVSLSVWSMYCQVFPTSILTIKQQSGRFQCAVSMRWWD